MATLYRMQFCIWHYTVEKDLQSVLYQITDCLGGMRDLKGWEMTTLFSVKNRLFIFPPAFATCLWGILPFESLFFRTHVVSENNFLGYLHILVIVNKKTAAVEK